MAWYDAIFGADDYGYPGVTPDMRTRGILAALRQAGGVLAQGAGTQGWGALSAALGAAPQIYREDLGERYKLRREEERASLDREYRESLMEDREERRRAQEEARQEKKRTEAERARQLQSRFEEREAKIADLVSRHPDKEAAIRKRLSPFLTESNFEERWVALLDDLEPFTPKAGKEPKLVRVTRPDGSVVLVPESEGMEVAPPSSTTSTWTPKQIWDEIQQERNKIIDLATERHDTPDDLEDRALAQAEARIRRLVPRDQWTKFLRTYDPANAPLRHGRTVNEAIAGRAPAPAALPDQDAAVELRELLPTLSAEEQQLVREALRRGKPAAEILEALRR